MKIIKIGRSSSNDVNINNDSLVSRAHCQIIQDDNGNFTLIDTNSKNGTFINGTMRHGEVRLNKSDIIRIGNTTLPWQTYFVGETDYDDSKTIAGNGGFSNSNNIYINSGNNGGCVPSTTKPDNFLVWAILGTIFCCLPFGIVSIVYASRVDGLWYAGDYDGAKDAARKARTWFWWAFGIGLASSLFWLVYYIIVGVAIGLS